MYPTTWHLADCTFLSRIKPMGTTRQLPMIITYWMEDRFIRHCYIISSRPTSHSRYDTLSIKELRVPVRREDVDTYDRGQEGASRELPRAYTAVGDIGPRIVERLKVKIEICIG